VLALGATIMTNAREIAADDFFRGMFETVLAPGELTGSIRTDANEATPSRC
jgi:aerobic carbon-monoxide dehydrogenase medium subunit